MASLLSVGVIVPTGAFAERAALIRRALASILSQEGVNAVPVVVVNGPNRCPELVRELGSDPRVRLIEIPQAGIPGALSAGRDAMQCEWFSSLDDDDLYLPDALATRVQALRARPECGAVVTNGYVRGHGVERLHVPDMQRVARDPLKALTEGNWLLPGSWMCRTESVGSGLFHRMPRMLECTYLALQLVLHCRPCFLDRPTVVWNTDTPGSASKSRDYRIGHVEALEQLLQLPLPPDTRRWLMASRTSARHERADFHLREKALLQAWPWHIRTLTSRGGWRHAPFMLRLLLAALRR
ncbi:glycosyltransferase [Halofilum ochraceum]|uniref:glycosyltransferase n=1 Tax=Halofilum ochraceum TaxID=1611323 RepID=UPI0008DA7B26|nr:glycosyltransferase [Halofilum ochraceum]